MMKRYFSILLALVISTSIVGCGNANAKSDSANDSNNVTVNNVQVESEKVSDISSPEVDNYVTAQATVGEPQPTTESVSSGSLYTLPVGAKGEEWSEAQLDSYLANCKAYQEAIKPNDKGKIKVDVDEFMASFGFEYVDTFKQKPTATYNVYWRQSGNTKMVIQFDAVDHVDIYIESGSESACVMLGDFSNDDFSIIMVTDNFGDGERPQKISKLYLKGLASVLLTLTEAKSFDCGRLPYPDTYILARSNGTPFNLQKKLDYAHIDYVLEQERVYYK